MIISTAQIRTLFFGIGMCVVIISGFFFPNPFSLINMILLSLGLLLMAFIMILTAFSKLMNRKNHFYVIKGLNIKEIALEI